MKIQKKKLGGGSGGVGGRGRVRVDVIEQLKFLRKFTQKIRGVGGGVRGMGGGSGWM